VIREADVFCFPTYYANEAQPINLIEAAAFGLPLVTTRWRSIPEFMPPGHPGLVNPRQPAEVAAALVAVLGDDGVAFRDLYEKQFSLARHLEALAAALRRTDPAL
jgi:glycosyltransferase involved in cell wall biosynthesis